MGVRATAIIGICLLALAGAVFAASSWHAWSWQGIWNGTSRTAHMGGANGTFNSSSHGAGFRQEANGTWNASFSGMGFRQNANGTRNAGQFMHRNGNYSQSNSTELARMAGNYQQFNSTELAQFNAAVASGDYATAESLHNSYGLGGNLFGKLNETTFAQYSQITGLQNQVKNLTGALRQELGLNSTGQRMAAGAAGAQGFAGFRGMAPGSARTGMRGLGMMH